MSLFLNFHNAQFLETSKFLWFSLHEKEALGRKSLRGLKWTPHEERERERPEIQPGCPLAGLFFKLMFYM